MAVPATKGPPRFRHDRPGEWLLRNLPAVWNLIGDAYVEGQGVELSSGQVGVLANLVIAMNEEICEAQAEKARIRLIYKQGGRDAVVKALGLTNPRNKGNRSPVGWTWKEAADWYVSATSGEGTLAVPSGTTPLDLAVLEGRSRRELQTREIKVLRNAMRFRGVVNADMWRVRELGGLDAIERPADAMFAIRLIARLMGVGPRRAQERLRPKLKSRGLGDRLPPERAFR